MNHHHEGWGYEHEYKGCLAEIVIIRIDIDTDTVTGKKSEDTHMVAGEKKYSKLEEIRSSRS